MCRVNKSSFSELSDTLIQVISASVPPDDSCKEQNVVTEQD